MDLIDWSLFLLLKVVADFTFFLEMSKNWQEHKYSFHRRAQLGSFWTYKLQNTTQKKQEKTENGQKKHKKKIGVWPGIEPGSPGPQKRSFRLLSH